MERETRRAGCVIISLCNRDIKRARKVCRGGCLRAMPATAPTNTIDDDNIRRTGLLNAAQAPGISLQPA